MTQKVGPPKAGHARVVMLREKSFGIVDSVSRFELDGAPIQGLKAGTYAYADRPAGQHLPLDETAARTTLAELRLAE